MDTPVEDHRRRQARGVHDPCDSPAREDAMYSWLIGKYIRHQLRRLFDGDVDATVRQFTHQAELVFPGKNSFAGTFRGRAEVRGWLARFVSLRPQYTVHDVLVSGPPWNMRVAWHLTDSIGAHYTNEGIVYLRMSWGKVRSERVFLDTEAVSEWEAAYPEESGAQGG
jgi:ketosteroid isomerase-like protein